MRLARRGPSRLSGNLPMMTPRATAWKVPLADIVGVLRLPALFLVLVCFDCYDGPKSTDRLTAQAREHAAWLLCKNPQLRDEYGAKLSDGTLTRGDLITMERQLASSPHP